MDKDQEFIIYKRGETIPLLIGKSKACAEIMGLTETAFMAMYDRFNYREVKDPCFRIYKMGEQAKEA